MSDLVNYVREHTERNACKCGRCPPNQTGSPVLYLHGEHPDVELPHSVDMFFFDVSARNNPDAETLRKLVKEHKGEFCDVDLFDGVEHSYIELGGWIGDQGLAMQLMGLGVLLGLWQVLHPVNMLHLDRKDPLAQQMAGMGMVSLLAKKG